ncbi:YebC-like protein [Acaromyces ingoldii]|uniref:YebC-like protein n=1 Tax=Acaromyces ingoldii TaxID=215250 RepID=A0A316YU91_9BASI|nr:YebC-like protein [Acaromyces ingoldii]PWN91285.1 YebC-like protein [Acaromyces ingoldii]
MLSAARSRLTISVQRARCSSTSLAGASLSTSAPSLSGHNKWSKIRHKKAANDSARSHSYGILSREIIASIRSHPTRSTSTADNVRLNYLLKKAREMDIPNSKVEATLKKAVGGGSGSGDKTATYEVVVHLGGESQPVSLVLECNTDGSNRTHSKVKESIHKHGARLSSTMHLFTRRGTVRVLLPSGSDKTFEDVWEAAVELGAEEVLPWAEDVDEEDEGQEPRIGAEVHCEPSQVQDLAKSLSVDPHGLIVVEAEAKLVPSGAPLRVRDQDDPVEEPGEAAGFVMAADIEKLDRLVEALEDGAECQRVW